MFVCVYVCIYVYTYIRHIHTKTLLLLCNSHLCRYGLYRTCEGEGIQGGASQEGMHSGRQGIDRLLQNLLEILPMTYIAQSRKALVREKSRKALVWEKSGKALVQEKSRKALVREKSGKTLVQEKSGKTLVRERSGKKSGKSPG